VWKLKCQLTCKKVGQLVQTIKCEMSVIKNEFSQIKYNWVQLRDLFTLLAAQKR